LYDHRLTKLDRRVAAARMMDWADDARWLL